MGRDDDRVEAEQRRLGGRFGGEDVEGGAGDDAVAERLGEGRLVDDPAAGDVDDAQPGLGLEQQVTTDQPGRLGSLRQVDGEEVGLGDDLLEGHQFDAAAAPLGRHVRVEGDEAHPEGPGPVGDELADASETDDAQRLVGELDALPLAPLPAAIDEGGVRLRDVAGLGEQQRHRVLGSRDDVRLGGVDDHHAAGGGGVEVDVVEPDPGPADDHQAVGGASSSASTVVAERMISASAPAIAASSSSRDSPSCTSTVCPAARALQPLSAISSVTRMRHGLHAYRRRPPPPNYVRRPVEDSAAPTNHR